MDTTAYSSRLVDQLSDVTDLGDEDTRLAGQMIANVMEPAVRTTLIDAIGEVCVEASAVMSAGHLETRLVGPSLEIVFVEAPAEASVQEPAPLPPDAEGENVARISLRLPDDLKARVESVSAAQGQSVNAWLVRAIAVAVQGAASPSGAGQPQWGRRNRRRVSGNATF